ncbi:MAG: NAD-dependent protein deacylase [Bacilli bacterium]|nr:NAD-dependent protein deacylase [Bacilli bacterium]
MDSLSDLEKAKQWCHQARHIVFLGGAGVSTGSGIPDFRSPQGLYNIKSKYGVPYEEMLSHTYFLEHTSTFYEFYWHTMVSLAAKPNKAHLALSSFEKRGHRITIVTQNIDGLHQEAGSKEVLEAHGTTKKYRCMGCRKEFDLNELSPKGVPHCPNCGSIIKPQVVLYEEPLDDDTIYEAVKATEDADLLIVGGTSMRVYPIAGLVNYYRSSRAIMINREATPFDSRCQLVFRGDIGDVLEAILSD